MAGVASPSATASFVPSLTGGAGGAGGNVTTPINIDQGNSINFGATSGTTFWLIFAGLIGGIFWLRRK